MVPAFRLTAELRHPAPRTRGDGPKQQAPQILVPFCSPHPRGWSLVQHAPVQGEPLLPAPAGMVPVPDRQGIRGHDCSPHPRGWSRRRALQVHAARLLPAPAGMVPPPREHEIPAATAPRTRGDGPESPSRTTNQNACSPHPRGWSQRRSGRVTASQLLPAPAGMVPAARPAASCSTPAPRTRGDGPRFRRPVNAARACSPHPRGWSPVVTLLVPCRVLLPAPAGMVPDKEGRDGPEGTAPCTRGDGPGSVNVP